MQTVADDQQHMIYPLAMQLFCAPVVFDDHVLGLSLKSFALCHIAWTFDCWRVKYLKKLSKEKYPLSPTLDWKMENNLYVWGVFLGVWVWNLTAFPHAIAIAGPWLNPTMNVDDRVWECRTGSQKQRWSGQWFCPKKLKNNLQTEHYSNHFIFHLPAVESFPVFSCFKGESLCPLGENRVRKILSLASRAAVGELNPGESVWWQQSVVGSFHQVQAWFCLQDVRQGERVCLLCVQILNYHILYIPNL